MQRAELNNSEFDFFRKLIFDLTGINLSIDKKLLVQSRLAPFILKQGFEDFENFKSWLLQPDRTELDFQNFVNLLTTNKTDFFREPEHFKYLVESLIPRFIQNKKRHLKIWSAACSSGEEPYTLAMVLRHHLPRHIDFSIEATDIDTKVIEMARNGVYPLSKLSEIPLNYQAQSIIKGHGEVSKWFKIRDQLSEKIHFNRHNLIQLNPNYISQFDIIFCRNVLIYFTRDTISHVVSILSKCINDSGVLFIGHTETLNGLNLDLQSVGFSIYQKAKLEVHRVA